MRTQVATQVRIPHPSGFMRARNRLGKRAPGGGGGEGADQAKDARMRHYERWQASSLAFDALPPGFHLGRAVAPAAREHRTV